MDPNKSSSSDEIDITQFFRWIGSGFRRFGNGILYGLAGLRRLFVTNLLFFSIMMAVGMVIGVAYSGFLEKKHYTSSMIIKCDYLNMRIVQNSIDKLNLLCNEKDKTGLAEALNIDIATAKNIVKFEARNFVSENDRVEIEVLKEQLANLAADKQDLVNKVIGKIELGNRQSYYIMVQVYDPDVVKRLEEAIINHFRNNEYVSKRIERNERSLLARKQKLVRESRKLDSLKGVLFENFQSMAKQSREGSNNVILSDKYLMDPLEVFKEDLNLNNEIRAIDDELFIKPSFELVDGLTTFRKPDNFSLKMAIALSLVGSILGGYILLGLWKFNLYLARLDPAS
jgi:flagellar biosynthesis chaperone FliJ